MKYFLACICCLAFWQCKTPIVTFTQSDHQVSYEIPARIHFTNQSENITSQVWKINGNPVSIDKNLQYTFFESGRHTIELEARSGSQIIQKQQEVIIKPSVYCQVLIKTSVGDMVLQLDENTPVHLSHFVSLVDEGYYDGIYFHRVIDDFMIQGGDNKSRHGGKKREDPSSIPNEISRDRLHYKGALAAARLPDDINPEKRSSGSQFYIVDGQSFTQEKFEKTIANLAMDYSDEQIMKYVEIGGAPQLDGEYTVFGRLIYGFDVLDKIAEAATDNLDKPIEDILILQAKSLN